MVLHNGYGVTECSPTIALTRPGSHLAPTPPLARPFRGLRSSSSAATAKQRIAGEVGELRVRGPNIMKGYYHAPEETAAAIDAEGWFNTRDLARLEDGNLIIVGRTEDLIVHRGFNVYPAEVEAVLNAHPAVVQSAVVGRSVAGDEEVVAFVQTAARLNANGNPILRNMPRSVLPPTSDLPRFLMVPIDAGDAYRKSCKRRTGKDGSTRKYRCRDS